MKPSDVIPQLNDPNPCFVCRASFNHESGTRYRVPVVNVPLPCAMSDGPDTAAARAALARLPELPGREQLTALVGGGEGIGLWVPRALDECRDTLQAGTREAQLAAGSLVIFPPHEWGVLRDRLKDWFFDGVEAGFAGLPYGFDDVLPFAAPNFNADCWFLVLRGPMAGKVCWWTHDGDSVMDRPWAEDLRGWGRRVFAETPEVLGGTVRFTAEDSIDRAPNGAELRPERYLPEMGA